MAKEKFVRTKPHIAIIFSLAIFIIILGVTLLYPEVVPPGNLLFVPGSALPANTSTILIKALFNGGLYGVITFVLLTIVMKGKKILQN
ncbi:MAG: hypothetical protein ACFFC7_14895 [Candidatus Hermodarchaeota archaeon]